MTAPSTTPSTATTATTATTAAGPSSTATTEPAGRFGHATVGAPPPYRDPGEKPADDGPARRRWPKVLALVLTAVLLLTAALLGGRAWGARGQTDVWQLTHDVAAGETLRGGDVRAVRVSTDAAAGALRADRPLTRGVTAAALSAGTVLRRGQLGTTGVVPGPTDTLVGVAAAAGLAPQGLRPGDTVVVIALPEEDQGAAPKPKKAAAGGTVLVGSATVQRVIDGGAQGSVVTLVIPLGRSVEMATLAAQNRIALVAAGG
jgi:hypothetical protein